MGVGQPATHTSLERSERNLENLALSYTAKNLIPYFFCQEKRRKKRLQILLTPQTFSSDVIRYAHRHEFARLFLDVHNSNFD